MADLVTGTVTAFDGVTVTLEVGTDPDTGETLTVSAVVPVLEVGAVAHVVFGPFGAVALPGPGAGGAPTLIEFRTFAELRDGITVPRPPAREDDNE